MPDGSPSASAPAHKACPDCAEQVLAAARKCRYCGYRFERRRGQRGSLFGELLSGRRRGSDDGTFAEILADWGTSLGEGEVVEWFRLTEVDHRPGYLLLTSRRLVFFRELSSTRHERALEYPLSLLSDVRLSGAPMKRRLELRAGVLGHAIHAPGHGELDRLNQYLERVLTQKQSVAAERSDG